MRRFFRCKKIVITIIIVFLIVSCVFPFPVGHKFKTQGWQITKEGEVVDDVIISVQLWELDYLFKSNRVRGNIEIVAAHDVINLELSGPVFQKDAKVNLIATSYYNQFANRYCSGYIVFDKEYDALMIFVNEDAVNTIYYVGSKHQQIQPQDIFSKFTVHISSF